MSGQSSAGDVPETAVQKMYVALEAHRSGALRRAEATYRELTQAYPDFADAWHFYGVLKYQRGDNPEALKYMRRAQHMAPDNVDMLLNFGRTLGECGLLDEAREQLFRAWRVAPSDPRTLLAYGRCLLNMARGGELVDALKARLKMDPNSWELWMLLGECHEQNGESPGARTAFSEAAKLAPARELLPRLRHGEHALEAADTEVAEAEFNAVLTANPRSAGACLGLAALAAQAGDFSRAETMAEKALRCDQRAYYAWILLAGVCNSEDEKNLLARVQHARIRASKDPYCWPLDFAQGALLERQKDYDLAFSAYRRGNEGQGRGRPYSRAVQENHVRNLIEGLDRRFVERASRIGVLGSGAIFICGMPRSGTTLVETILACHPAVKPGGEMQFLHERLLRLVGLERFSEIGSWLADATDADLSGLASDWRDAILRSASGLERVTDKLPGNFHLLGLIHVCFPDAPIIYVRREPRDNCLSCYTTPFQAGPTFAHKLESIGHYYRVHEKMMEHWRAMLGAERIIEVEYEALVRHPEAEIARLLKGLGLRWHADCLNFHRHDRHVNTASIFQVRQPAHTRSVGRWRKFDRHLSPLLEALSEPISL